MGLIKSAEAPRSIQPFSMLDIENQARVTLLRARQQAEQLLAAAQFEAEALKTKAQKDGFAEGRAKGLAAGREEGHKAGRDQALAQHRGELISLIGSLTKVLAEFDQSRRELESSVLHEVLSLAIAIGERVTKRQGVLDPKVALENTAAALQLVVHASDVRIAIHPTQKSVLSEAMPRLKMQWPNLAHAELIEDPTLTPGGIRLFTAHGMIDGDLNLQLDRVIADLLPDAQEAGK